jgi:hypothetical protein
MNPAGTRHEYEFEPMYGLFQVTRTVPAAVA